MFLVTGLDAEKHFYGLTGEVQLDGQGNVTAGEQDFTDANGLNSNGATPDTISAGTYTIGSDGRGTMTLPTSNTKLGASGVETFSIAVVNGKHALITEFDTGATGSGTLDFQTLGTSGLDQSVGGWSFVDVGQNNHASYSQGGVFTLNASSQNAICPQSTTPCYPLSQIVTDFDEIDNGTRQVTIGDPNGTGYFMPPDQFGRGAAYYGGIYWDYYVVSPEVMRLLGYFPQTGTFSQLYVGSAYSQGTGTFSASSFSGSFAFTDAGTVQTTTYGAAGLISFDGKSAISGFADVSEGSAAPTSAAFSGTYQMNIPISFNNAAAAPVNGYGQMTITPGATQDVSVIGMYAVDPNLNVTDPNDTTTQHGPGAILTDLDQNVNGGGVLLGQETPSGAAQGNFALNSQVVTATNGELDLVGQAAANGSNQFTGNVDVNDFAFSTGASSGLAFSATLTPDASHTGRFTTPIMLSLSGNPQTINAVFYQVSDSQFVVVDVGTGISGTGIVEKQQ